MTQLQASLLGPFRLATGDGEPISVETRKARAVLAVLLVARGRPVQRDRLATDLWGRSATQQALASLSQAVYSLRRAFADVGLDIIRAGTDSLAIDPEPVSTDLWQLEEAVARGDDAGNRRCLQLYDGGFLDDLPIHIEEGYSDWRDAERARIEGAVVGAGTSLMADWQSNPERIETALVDRLLNIDPYNEPAIRVRMIALARERRQAAAIEAGQEFASRLAADLDIAPSEDFAALEAEIRSGAHAPPAVNAPQARGHRRMGPLAALTAVVTLVAGLGLMWLWSLRDTGPQPDVVRLLVRPFEAAGDLAPDVAAGFSDDLSTALVRRAALDVLSRESGRLIAGDDDAASGASHVLRGRLRGEGDRWVLNAWISDITTGEQVWADRVQGRSDASSAVRDEIVARLSDGIGASLLPTPQATVAALPEGTWHDYLRALSQLHTGTAEGNAAAIDRLTEIVEAHPQASDAVAALVLGYERVAFGADDFAVAAGLHWLEGYLRLKRQLALTKTAHPGLLAARARLALRREDHARAQALARQALQIAPSNIAALEVLARSLALSGEADEARNFAARAVALSPAAPEEGYTALALAEFTAGDMAAAIEAVEAALETARGHPLDLLALRAAMLGLSGDADAAHASFETLVEAVESRPYAAWRTGDIAFRNPRSETWRRPSATEVSELLRYTVEPAARQVRAGLFAAASRGRSGAEAPERTEVLSGAEIGEVMFNRRIEGEPTWLVQQGWSQVRTAGGELVQYGAFGPLPQAQNGRSDVVDGRLCDSWQWQGVDLQVCQLVVHFPKEDSYALIGETAHYPFRASAMITSEDP